MSENKEAINLLLNKEEYADKLTEWEVAFLDSVQHKADRLSQKQQEKLDEIWERVVERQ